MHRVTINGEVLFAWEGELLSDVLIRHSDYVEHPCGGKGTCRKCLVTVNGKEELSCQYIIKSDITVALPAGNKVGSPNEVKLPDEIDGELCYVLDIGTTTLALSLVHIDDKKIISSVTRINPQRVFGADVMSRIECCRNKSARELQKILINAINEMCAELGGCKCKKMYVVGNTVMLHLFFGVDCSSMGEFPYTPVFLNSRLSPSSDVGITFVDEVEALPSAAAFVGADIVAGLNYVSMPSDGKFNILVDLGTNAEIVLYSGTSALCTSAAAGPCFEGANITCGMSAVNGAVYAYESGEAFTVGNEPAKGLCGTGLVDVIAYLLYNKKIDHTGLMNSGRFDIANGVFLNQADIRQYQTAKSAVYSGIITLLKIKGITFDDIETFYISGGFADAINVNNAAATGLIPLQLAEKCIAVSNSAMLGAVKYACEGRGLCFSAMNMRYIDLSSNPLFTSSFIESIDFITEG